MPQELAELEENYIMIFRKPLVDGSAADLSRFGTAELVAEVERRLDAT